MRQIYEKVGGSMLAMAEKATGYIISGKQGFEKVPAFPTSGKYREMTVCQSSSPGVLCSIASGKFQ